MTDKPQPTFAQGGLIEAPLPPFISDCYFPTGTLFRLQKDAEAMSQSDVRTHYNPTPGIPNHLCD